MSSDRTYFLDVSDLRIGIFVYLDLSWTEHPFSMSSFKLRSQQQIDTIRTLGLSRIRYSPERSDPEALQALAGAQNTPDEVKPVEAAVEKPLIQKTSHRQALWAAQQESLAQCERQFADASRGYKSIQKLVQDRPAVARQQATALIEGLLDKIQTDQETTIRLLSEKAGEERSLHAINVSIIALLFGKALVLAPGRLKALGLGALLHDVGKIRLPEHLRWGDLPMNPLDKQLFQRHVTYGLEIARNMGVDEEVLMLIGQHHEFVDGSGYPEGLRGDRMTLSCQLLSIVNLYDNLCNPANPPQAMTPHEAMSILFAKMRSRFEKDLLVSFVRMMGVYPPGSLVELNDSRYAIVTSVSTTQPLKPTVLVYDPQIPREEALLLNLEQTPELGVQRSLKPLQLPRRAFEYLSPGRRVCYFFERARSLSCHDPER